MYLLLLHQYVGLCMSMYNKRLSAQLLYKMFCAVYFLVSILLLLLLLLLSWLSLFSYCTCCMPLLWLSFVPFKRNEKDSHSHCRARTMNKHTQQKKKRRRENRIKLQHFSLLFRVFVWFRSWSNEKI